MSRAEAEGADGEVPVAAHGPRPDALASKTRRGLLFQAMKNRYLVGTGRTGCIHGASDSGSLCGSAQGPQVSPGLGRGSTVQGSPSSPRMRALLPVPAMVMGVVLCRRLVGGVTVLVLLGWGFGWKVGPSRGGSPSSRGCCYAGPGSGEPPGCALGCCWGVPRAAPPRACAYGLGHVIGAALWPRDVCWRGSRRSL